MNYLYTALGIAVATIATPFVALVSLLYVRTYSVPSELPWAGLKNKRLLPKLRANLREFTAGREPFKEGYEKYNKQGKAFVLPSSQSPDVALPPSDIAWIASQPETVLSASKVQEDILALRYLSHGPNHTARFDFSVIRRDVTRNLSKVLPEIINEINLCFEEKLGDDIKDWKEVKIFEVITETSRRLNNRLFVGQPLCWDERYIHGLETWELYFGVSSAVIRYLIPDVLKAWLAPLAAVPVRFQAWRLKRLLLPRIRERIAAQVKTRESKLQEQRPHDVLQWLIDAESDRKSAHGMSVDDIAGKAIALNFFGMASHVEHGSCAAILTIEYFSRPHSLHQLRLDLDRHLVLRICDLIDC